MVITKTPFRMSFFGGGTDFPDFYNEHGGAVLSTTFDKYCYVNVRHLPPFFDYSSEISYSEIERVKSTDEIKHPSVRECMKYYDMRDIRLTYEADLPARTGLGTSSSFAVGMLSAFHALKGKLKDKKSLAEEAIHLERVLCNEAGGVQDQIAVAFGGLNRIDFSAAGFQVNPITISNERKNRLNSNLMMFFTGFSRFSSEIQPSTQSAIKENDKVKQLLEMYSLVDEAQKILVDKDADLDDFGRLLDHTWRLKRGISGRISTNTLDGIYERAISCGALGGKLLGAGGGGFFVFYVQPDKQDEVLAGLKDLLYIPFKFENDGVSTIYYSAEDYDLK